MGKFKPWYKALCHLTLKAWILYCGATSWEEKKYYKNLKNKNNFFMIFSIELRTNAKRIKINISLIYKVMGDYERLFLYKNCCYVRINLNVL